MPKNYIFIDFFFTLICCTGTSLLSGKVLVCMLLHNLIQHAEINRQNYRSYYCLNPTKGKRTSVLCIVILFTKGGPFFRI